MLPAQWTDVELAGLKANYPDMQGVYDTHPSKYNPRPGDLRNKIGLNVCARRTLNILAFSGNKRMIWPRDHRLGA